MTINIFISYSHKDEAFREQLAKHLVPLQRVKDVELWFDGDILPGEALTPEIRRKLKQSDILVALASHHYLASDYCFNKEYGPAMRRVAKGTMHVVAVLLSACEWQNTRMENYKLLPKDGKEVERWGSRNQAYVDIVAGIRRVVAAVRAETKKAEASRDKAAPKPQSQGRKKPTRPSGVTEGTKATGRPKPPAGGRPKPNNSAEGSSRPQKPTTISVKPKIKRSVAKGAPRKPR